MPYNNATLLDVFTAGTNFGNHVMDRAEKWNLEKAQIELTAMKNQFNTDVNNELMKLQKSNNWENWDSQINDFMEKTVSRTGDSNSPYFCRNPYMAQAATQMFEAEKVQLDQKVQQMKWQKESEHMINLYNKNREADRTNMLLTAQQRYDQGRAEAKAMYEGGVLSETQYNQENDRLFQQAYSDDVISKVSSAFDEAIQNNMSFENLWQVYKNSNPETMKRYGMEGMEEATDFSGLDASLKKSLKEDYTARVKDMQQKNADYLSTVYQRLEAAETETDKLQIRREGQRYLQQLKGMQLDEQSRNEYAYKFRIEAQKAAAVSSDNGGNGKTNSTTTSKGKGVDIGGIDGPVETWATVQKTGYSSTYNYIKDGTYSEEQALAVLDQYYETRINNNQVKEAANLDQEGKDFFYAERAIPAVNGFEDYVLEQVFQNGRYKEEKTVAEQFLKEVMKPGNNFPPGTYSHFIEGLINLVSDNNYYQSTAEERLKVITKMTQGSYAAALDAAKEKKNISIRENGAIEFTSNKDMNDYFTKATYAAETIDPVYGNANGLNWRTEADKKAQETYEKTSVEMFASLFDINPADVKVTYKKQVGDETPQLVLKNINSPQSYTLSTVEDEKGNRKAVLINDSTGKLVDLPDYNKRQKQAAANTKQQQQEAKANTQAAQKSTNELVKKRQENVEKAINGNEAPDIVKKYNQDKAANWNKTSSAAKGKLMDETQNMINADIKRIKAMANGFDKSNAMQEFTTKVGIQPGVASFNKFAEEWEKADATARGNYLAVGSWY